MNKKEAKKNRFFFFINTKQLHNFCTFAVVNQL